MVGAPLSPLDQLGRRFLNLPREVRDLIYPHIVRQGAPLDIINHIIQVPLDHSVICAEWLEATYTHNICSVAFSDFRLERDGNSQCSIWGPQTRYKRFIRHLIINASEAVLWESDLARLEDECTMKIPEARQEWNKLLDLPRLESLTINLQKRTPRGLVWANFSPIVYQLRERSNKLCVVFCVSFDAILEDKWNSDLALEQERGLWAPHQLGNDPYLPMGFVDMSELLKAPTTEDMAYVEEYLPEARNIESLDIVRGLLDETPANRRLLAQHYVAREPGLLRILMAEHYEIYKQAQTLGGEATSKANEALMLLDT